MKSNVYICLKSDDIILKMVYKYSLNDFTFHFHKIKFKKN